MDLKESLRRQRAQGREKEPFSPSLFTRVGGVVRQHRLGEDFCRFLRELNPASTINLVRTFQASSKAHYEPSLFFLATPEEYQVIQEIHSGGANPYLAWANSPEEILLAGPLYIKHPGLTVEELTSRHFAALLG
jgi:hypothetical protein